MRDLPLSRRHLLTLGVIALGGASVVRTSVASALATTFTETQSIRRLHGSEVGTMYVPRLRANVWNMPIYDGVSTAQLDRGLGRIPGSVMPGEWGNFSVAGHRTKAVRPFYFVERLRKNDVIIVRTPQAWFTYRLMAQQIVIPQASWVLDPAPAPTKIEGLSGASRLLTIVTCTPRGTTDKRWIWWGRLTAVSPPEIRPPAIR